MLLTFLTEFLDLSSVRIALLTVVFKKKIYLEVFTQDFTFVFPNILWA